MAAVVLSGLAASSARAFTLPVTGPPDAPSMVFDNQMQVASVCLPVTNPQGGQSLLYGQRFTDGPVSSFTPAIVLVHGIASSTENWDFSSTWSVARALASAGYVVFSYDRLGYAKSNYFDHPGGGYTLTTAAHRAMLHDVVSDVKTGGYGVTSSGDCAGGTTPGDTKNPTVVIIGHSAGGWIVAGYPGQYHDVAAMIQADISGSSSAPGSSSGGGFTPDPSHPDYFEFFQTTQNCLDFNTYPPGIVQYVTNIACTPPFLDSPFGEIADLGAMYAQNDANIAMIGPSTPVLLTSGDHDTTDPPTDADADYQYYKAHCGCDVTQLMLPNTAHLFMVHRSLPDWVDYVVNWLSSRGIGGLPPHGIGGLPPTPGTQGCPKPSGRLHRLALGPLKLGFTRAHARQALPRFGVTYNNMDNFCLFGWGIRAGYPSAKLKRHLRPGLRRGVNGRVILLLTANPYYGLNGVHPGSRLAAARRRLHLGKRLHIGRNDWYVVPGRFSNGLLKVRGGIVQEVGIINRQLSRDRGAQSRLLTSFTAA
ncbi:MAG: alpha/beta fold hydrolase [Mycobacterium sp.]|nr:alpha/beta fold hydrolase [Mycobacterium sp.]